VWGGEPWRTGPPAGGHASRKDQTAAQPPSKDTILEALRSLLGGDEHTDLVGQLKHALQEPEKPPPVRTAEQALQSALSIFTDREKQFQSAVDDVDEAQGWLDQASARQEHAALELVQAKKACKQAQE